MGNDKSREFQARTGEIEALLKKLETAGDPELHATALELIQYVIDLHGAALDRLIDIIGQDAAGETALFKALEDDLVSSMFLLHGLHPETVETRVLRALDKVRPYLQSHGGDVELLSVSEGILKVRLQGTCGTCASSSLTMKNAVDEAVCDAAPEITTIIAEEAREQLGSSKLVVLQ
ncbi:MAG: NifU family protein [Acidobacteriaceae bacterium]